MRICPALKATWLVLLLAGCHREGFAASDWAIIAVGTLFLIAVYGIDQWRLHAGYRVEPAPYVGMNEPTTLQAKVAHEADKQQEQAGGKS